MRSKLTTFLTVVGAVTILVLAANTVALATTGKAILAGKINKASKVTSIVRTTPGTALQVRTKSGANAPLAVNGTGKVANLNADKVDGLDGGTRALAWSYTGNITGTVQFKLTGLPAGTYLISYAVFMNNLSSVVGTPVSCSVIQMQEPGGFSGTTDSAKTASSFPALSGTALMTRSAGNLAVHCNVPDGATWTAPVYDPVRITAVPIAGVTNKGVPTPMSPPT